jgi:hypothetical protein
MTALVTDMALVQAEPSWLRAVLAAARVRVCERRAGWSTHHQEGGLHAEIDSILKSEGPGQDERIAGAVAAIAEDQRWENLASVCSLTPLDQQWLALLTATAVAPGLRRVLAYLDNDLVPLDPTPAIAACLWGWPRGAMPAATSALARWEIAQPLDERWSPSSLWTVDPGVVSYLCGIDDWMSFWPGIDVRLEGRRGAPHDCLYPELLDELESTVRALPDAPVHLELWGRHGSGRTTLALQLCRRIGSSAVVVDGEARPIRALRTTRLLGGAAIWRSGLLPPLTTSGGSLDIVVSDRPTDRPPPGVVHLSRALPENTADGRRRLWRGLTDLGAPRAVVEWSLTPLEVCTSAAAAPAGERVATEVVRHRLGPRSSGLVTPLASPYEWKDLVLAPSVRSKLHDFEQQVRLRSEVLDDWGFARLLPTGRGSFVLFAGPSGTGKTMAAQVLANSLGLDLYRVDLAEVVNKYIGETEKRLSSLFDECEYANVLVFFDEADALFGRRTHVRDAHDRFANIEIDYLLQRMETFDGVAILATNRKGDLDDGFLRRLRAIVDFPAPTEPERRALWERVLPQHAPDGSRLTEDVDLGVLARRLELTGAEITSIALAAAFLARHQGCPIGPAHLETAANRELAKRGMILRSPLGEGERR